MFKQKPITQSIDTVSIQEVIEWIESGLIKYRTHNQPRVKLFKTYIVDNINSHFLFIPPVVINRSGEPQSEYTVIDGNVRIKALSQLKALIKEKEESEDIEDMIIGHKLRQFFEYGVISVQWFDSLSTETINQLYIDFNTKGKKVSLSKLIAYDSRNEINHITNEILNHNLELQIAGIEMEKRSVVKPRNSNLLSLSQLRRLITIFLTHVPTLTVPKGPIKTSLNKEENIELVSEWFYSLFELHEPATIGDYKQTILSSFPLLTAMAYYSIKDTEHLTFEEKQQVMCKRMQALHSLNFKTEHPIWNQFEGTINHKTNLIILRGTTTNILSLASWLEHVTKKEVRLM